MTSSFEDFLGESAAAISEGQRQIEQWRSEMQEAASKTSASLRECVEALRRRSIETDIELADHSYSLYPEHLEPKRGFLQPKKLPELVLGVETETLSRRTGWTLPKKDPTYALDTEGDLWFGYSVTAGVPFDAETEYGYSREEYTSLGRAAKAWGPKGFTRFDVDAWTERASRSFRVSDTGQAHVDESIYLNVATARKPVFALTHMRVSKLRWLLGGRLDKTELRIQLSAYDDENSLIGQVFEDVRDKIRSVRGDAS